MSQPHNVVGQLYSRKDGPGKVLLVDKDKSRYFGIPVKDLGGKGIRKFETIALLERVKDGVSQIIIR